MAWRGLEQDGPLAVDRGLLEAREDGAAGHRLLGEEVAGAHEHAHTGAGLGQGRGEGADHRGRAGVVHPAGEEDGHLVGVAEREQVLDLGVPEGEARPGADVAAALTALEDELAGPLLEEEVEQAGRGHVQEGADARGLEGRGLRRAAAGDEGDGRADVVDDLELRLAHLGGHEAEDADAPRAVAEQRGGLFQQGADLVARHEGEGEEGQPAAVGHRGGEGGAVADARHGALGDRVAGAEGGGEGAALGEGRGRGGGIEVLVDGAAQALGHAAGGAEAVGEALGEGAVLAHGQELGAQVVGAEGGHHVGGRRLRVGRGDGQVGAGEDAVPAEHHGLAAVHGPDGLADGGGQGGLAHEGQLRVEHDAHGPAGDGRRGGVAPDAPLGPDGAIGAGDEGLEQDVGGQVADAAPALGPLGDEPIGAGRQGGVGLLGRAHLDEDSASGSSPGGDVGGGRDDDGVDPFDQRDRVVGRCGDAHAEGLIGPAHHLGEGGGGHHGVTAEVDTLSERA